MSYITITIGAVVRLVLFASVAIAISAPSGAQELPPLPPPAFAPPQPFRPFGDLFAVQRPRKPKPVPLVNFPSAAPLVGSGSNERSLAICPMRSQPADPSFDAPMRQVVPDKTVAFTMRTAPRLACRQQ